MEAIDKASEDNASCLIIQMDTPGGLLNSTRTIVKKMLTSVVPLVVYVAPNGSRAGSAGVFITYASHIAAMAPSTNIGAAHPVQLGGGKENDRGGNWQDLKKILEDIKQTQEKNTQEADKKSSKNPKEKVDAPKEDAPYAHDENPMESKILNDTVAFIRAIAKERKRNVDWAVKSVVESASITAEEALEKKVIEFIAEDTQDLLNQIDGREVIIKGEPRILETKGAEVVTLEMDTRQKIFNALANPNIVYILFMLGFYGLLYEITHPGFGFPGIAGLICLIIAFYSMQALPTNYAGLALMMLGLIFMITEAFTPGFGLFAFGGVIALIIGSLFLFESTDPVMNVSKSLIAGTAVISAGFLIFLLKMLLDIRKRKSVSGADGMAGEIGIVEKDISADSEGKVFVHGELWNATAGVEIKKGSKIKVTAVNGMTVTVKPLK